MTDEKPTIEVLESAPFLVKGLKKLTDAEGNPIRPKVDKDIVALCRCGKSKDKPFCDGAHKDVGFSGACERTEEEPVREYKGEEITVVDNVGLCCYAGECVEGAESVFFTLKGEERVSTPDKGKLDEIIATIRKCPSGSLAYKLKGELHNIYFENSEPEIQIDKNGPLLVRGGIELDNADGPGPETTDHYALCRCGESKNKPFCDGSHSDAGFSDDN